MPSVIDLLTNDHNQVKSLFQNFTSQGADKSRLAEQICRELTVHAQLEEEIFYPECRNSLSDAGIIDKALADHASAKQLITTIEQSSDLNTLSTQMQQLQTAVTQHIQEEENTIFAQVKSSQMDLQAVGQKVADRKNQLTASSP